MASITCVIHKADANGHDDTAAIVVEVHQFPDVPETNSSVSVHNKGYVTGEIQYAFSGTAPEICQMAVHLWPTDPKITDAGPYKPD